MITQRHLRIGTRGSLLARVQCDEIRHRLITTAGFDAEAIAVQIVVTDGDRIKDRPLTDFGGKGAFIHALNQPLISGELDLVVHSLKDIPARLESGLVVACIPPRGDPRDSFIGRGGISWDRLPGGSIIGTAAPRRAAIVKHLRPDLEIRLMRGNIDTRLAKLAAGEYDAAILAYAGLQRIDRCDVISEIFAPEVMLPAVGQGALAVVTREDDHDLIAAISVLECAKSRQCVTAERRFLRALGGDCHSPIAGHADFVGEDLRLRGMVLSLDGALMRQTEIIGADAAQLGEAAAAAILEQIDDYADFALEPPTDLVL